MLIASCVVELQLPGVRSLKEKRSIIKSITKRLPQQFNIAVAEIDYQDRWDRSAIGVVSVGNDAGKLRSMLEKAVLWIERNRPDAPIIDYSIEVF